ncbi:flagellin N-terminal helical domain-containing protein [Maricaulis sp. CAU 1757]
MLSVNTNSGAAQALQSLAASQAERGRLEGRIATGLKIASPRDNGGLWGMARGLQSDRVTLLAQGDSLNRAASTLDVTLAALDGIGDILIEMRETALALTDSSLDAASFAALEADYAALFEQTVMIAEAASFNGTNLLDGDTLSLDPLGGNAIAGGNMVSLLRTGVATDPPTVDNNSVVNSSQSTTVTGNYSGVTNGNFTGDIYGNMSGVVNGWFNGDIYGDFSGSINGDYTGTIYGSNTGSINGNINGSVHNGAVDPPNPFTIAEEHAAFEDHVAFAFSGVDAPDSQPWDPATALDYKGKLASIDTLIRGLGGYSAALGSQLRSVTLQQTFLGHKADQIEAMHGNLVDADLARDSARLNAVQTREQLGLQALSIANSAPSTLLSLFR